MNGPDDLLDPVRDPILRGVAVHDGFKVLGPCAIQGRLGKGGMGTVFFGHHLRLNIPVAIKCIDLQSGGGEQLARFLREARLAAQLDHANIVRVYDCDEVDGVPYIIMELVDGEDAQGRVIRKGPLEVGEALAITHAAALGLGHAHHAGLVHRDVKPPNILISSRGMVKVGDLGLARPSAPGSGATLTGAGQVVGTPRYMAPEQWRDIGHVGAQADVWALGATLWFMLAGRDAVEGRDLTTIRQNAESGQVAAIREVRADVPAEAADLIAQCMAVRPEDRPADGAIVAVRLEVCLRGLGLVAGGDHVGASPARALVTPMSATMRTRLRASAVAALARRSASAATVATSLGSRTTWLLAAAAVVVIGLMVGLGAWFGWFGAGEPRLEVSTPLVDGRFYTRDLEAKLTGNVEHATEAWIWLLRDGGETRFPLDVYGTYSIPIRLQQGAVERVGLRVAGGGEPLGLEIVHDVVSPTITIVTPDPGWRTAQPSVRISARVDDVAVAAVRIGAGSLTQSVDGVWVGEFPLDSQGENTFQLTAVDQAQNSNSQTLMVVRDSRAPRLVSVQPVRGARVPLGRPLAVHVVFDESVARAMLAGEQMAITERSATVTIAPSQRLGGLTEGAWQLQLDVADDLDNAATYPLAYDAFAPDEIAPRLARCSPPRDSTVYLDEAVDFECTFDEPVRRVLLAGTGLQVKGRTASGRVTPRGEPGSWRPPLVAEDVAGNKVELELAFVAVLRPRQLPAGFRVIDATLGADRWPRVIEHQQTGVVLLLVEPGTFDMGAAEDALASDSERPQHEVVISDAFYLAQTELTQAQWCAVTPAWKFASADNLMPAAGLTWNDAVTFCETVGFVLPTEAQWEYACRASTTTRWSTGTQLRQDQARFAVDEADGPLPVKSFGANAFGFYDMHGNVREWCRDEWAPNYQVARSSHPGAFNPSGDNATGRVCRGGAFDREEKETRSSARYAANPALGLPSFGFRPAWLPSRRNR